jgi:hypothetical protein
VLTSETTLDFLLGPTNAMPGPRKDVAADSTTAGDERSSGGGGGGRGGSGDDEDEKPDVDLSVEVEDASGRTARIRLSDYGAIRRPLETYVMRRGDLERQRFQDHWELIQQTYSIPLGDFVAQNRALELRRLSAVRFVFDRVHAGEVAIDQIGFSHLPAEFLGARVDGR